MSKIRNTPHVYTPPLKRIHIKWYPGNDEGFNSPVMTLVDRMRAAIASGKQDRA